MRKGISGCGRQGQERQTVGTHLADPGGTTVLGSTVPALMIDVLHVRLREHAIHVRAIARQHGANGLQPRHHESQHEYDGQ